MYIYFPNFELINNLVKPNVQKTNIIFKISPSDLNSCNSFI